MWHLISPCPKAHPIIPSAALQSLECNVDPAITMLRSPRRVMVISGRKLIGVFFYFVILPIGIFHDIAPAHAQTFSKIGVIESLPEDYRFEMAEIESAGVVWSKEIKYSEVTKFMIHFSELNFPESGDVSIRLLDSVFNEIERIDFDNLDGKSELWAATVEGRFAQVVVKVDELPADRNNPVSFKMDKVGIQYANKEAKLQSIIGETDYKYSYEYDSDPALLHIARAVAKLEYVSGNSWGTCTGFLVSENLLITNEHCITKSEAETCASAKVYFGYHIERIPGDQEGTYQYIEAPAEVYHCKETLYSNNDADWSLLRLSGAPGNPDNWGYLSVDFNALAPDADGDGENLTLIHHPAGYRKMITKDNCRVMSMSVTGRNPGKFTDFGHSCDSIEGSSGSPLLNSNLAVVGNHHWGVIKDDPRWAAENRAISSPQFCLPSQIAQEIPGWRTCDD